MISISPLSVAVTIGLLIGAIICGVATERLKSEHNLAGVKFGAWPTYDVEDLEGLRKNTTANAIDARAAHFVSPILFPMDLLLLLCLGGFTAMASQLLIGPGRAPDGRAYALLLIPLAYVLCDLVENCLFARMLVLPSGRDVTLGMVWAARAATTLKLLAGGMAVAQVLWLLVRSIYFSYVK